VPNWRWEQHEEKSDKCEVVDCDPKKFNKVGAVNGCGGTCVEKCEKVECQAPFELVDAVDGCGGFCELVQIPIEIPEQPATPEPTPEEPKKEEPKKEEPKKEEEEEKSNDDDDTTMLTTIAYVGAGTAVLLAALLVVCCCCKQGKKKQQPAQKATIVKYGSKWVQLDEDGNKVVLQVAPAVACGQPIVAHPMVAQDVC